MGMFNKDKLFGGTRLDQWIDLGETFIVWNVRVREETITTEVGEARKTELLVSSQNEPTLCEVVGTLASAIADKADDAEPSDFPALVQTLKVGSSYGTDAFVLQFIAPYDPEGKQPTNKATGVIGTDFPDDAPVRLSTPEPAGKAK